jgi:FG-GAP-like repeat
MLKRSSLLAFGAVALAAPWLSDLGMANQPNNPPPAPAIPAFTAGPTPALLFRNMNDGMLSIMPMRGAQPWVTKEYNFSPVNNIGQAQLDWKVIGTGDFNNDGHGDILWRDDSGTLAIWEMAGTGLKNSPPTTTVPKLPGLTQKPFVADFNGDGISDLLWQGRSVRPSSDPPDLSSNSLYTYLTQIWTMAAGTTTPASTQSGSSISNWTAAGGQFGGDGGIDRFLRSSDGRTFFALSGGAIRPGPKNVAAEWEVKAVGDFNGDGTSDLLWQNRNNGTVSIWQVQNGTYVKSPFTSNVPIGEWQVLGAADMDGDGVSDIIWRNINGQVVVWLMSNYSIKNPDDKGFMVPTEWEFAGFLSTQPLGAWDGGIFYNAKSYSECNQQKTFTITGPLPETISRDFTGSTFFIPSMKSCAHFLTDTPFQTGGNQNLLFFNVAGTYRLEAGNLGGFDFTIVPGWQTGNSGCPDKADCPGGGTGGGGTGGGGTGVVPAANLNGSFSFSGSGTMPYDQTITVEGTLSTASSPNGAGLTTFGPKEFKGTNIPSGPIGQVGFSIDGLKQGTWRVTAIGMGSQTCIGVPVGGILQLSTPSTGLALCSSIPGGASSP